MPKIQYLDDGGEEKTIHRYRGRVGGRGGLFIVLFLILSFIMGIVGGIGGLVLISSSDQLKNKLGIDLQTLNINRTRTEKTPGPVRDDPTKGINGLWISRD